jgi:hypothetical protein
MGDPVAWSWHVPGIKLCVSVVPLLGATNKTTKQTLWLLVRKRTIPTDRPPLVGEVSANFLQIDGGQRNRFPWSLISVF